MTDDAFAATEAFVRWRLNKPLQDCTPLPIGPMELLTILWPLNDVFRPRVHAIGTLRYSTKFEPDADAAIDAFSRAPNPSTWEPLPWGCWRVLLERHMQMCEVATANWAAGRERMTFMPAELPAGDRLPFAMLALLRGMKLLRRPLDRARLELPEGLPEAPPQLQ